MNTEEGRNRTPDSAETEHRRVVQPIVGSADDWKEPHTRLWIILGVIAVCAVAVFALYWFVLRGRGQEGGAGSGKVQEVHPGLAGGAMDVVVTESAEDGGLAAVSGEAGAASGEGETETEAAISYLREWESKRI
jgi:hypothetical protein